MEANTSQHIVSESIAQLLLRHNCVIIPKMGGFIGNYEPAKIIEYAHKIIPPTKTLLFNTHLVNNDGLLIQHIANENNLNYNESENIVTEFVTSIKTSFNAGNRFEIEGVGFLFKQNSSGIGFEQDRSFNLYMSSFGLGTIRFVTFEMNTEHIETKVIVQEVVTETTKQVEKENEPIIITQKQPEKAVTQFKLKPEKIVAVNVKKKEDKQAIPISDPNKRKFKWSYAAAVIALPLVFYSLWIPVKSDVIKTKILHIEDFNPFFSTPEEKYAPIDQTQLENSTWKVDSLDFDKIAKNASTYNFRLFDNKMVTVRLDKTENIDSKDTAEVIENKTSTAHLVDNKFHLIVGCFSDKTNAESLVNDLKSKGFSAKIVDKNKGLFRVSAIQNNSKNAILDQRNQLQSSGFNSWVLEKS